MFLKIIARGKDADKISYILGKNPNRLFVKTERCLLNDVTFPTLSNGEVNFADINKGELSSELISFLKKDNVLDSELNVINKNNKTQYFMSGNSLIRKKLGEAIETYFFFKTYEPEHIEAVLYSIPDSVTFSKEFEGYVNEKEYLVSSVFQTEINDVLKNGLTKTGEMYDLEFDITLEVGPFKAKLNEETIRRMFEELGFSVNIQSCNEPISFTNKRQLVCFLTLNKNGRMIDVLRQLVVLISAIDNFKHFKPKEQDLEKLKKYAEGWLPKHSMCKMITERYLSYSTYSDIFLSEVNEQKTIEPSYSQEKMIEEDKGYGENGMKLNELRLQKVKNAVSRLQGRRVLDFGCGEGNLLQILGFEDLDVTGVDSSLRALSKAGYKMDKLSKHPSFHKPTIFQSSLYYRDSRLNNFDTIVLCEVIEHVELERLSSVIANIMSANPKNIIISTPNRDFNKFFNRATELRHYDHRFEFTAEEFEGFCKNLHVNYGYDYSIEFFGKTIEGIQPTMMASFVKREENSVV